MSEEATFCFFLGMVSTIILQLAAAVVWNWTNPMPKKVYRAPRANIDREDYSKNKKGVSDED